jgi:RNA polymerase sigma-70 factor (ECF subfamily)
LRQYSLFDKNLKRRALLAFILNQHTLATKSTENEGGLIRDLASGDRTAIERIFHLYYETIVQIVLRIVADTHLAQDLAQDVFVGIWQNRERITINTSIKAYLHRAALNRAFNYLRDNRLKWDLEEKLEMQAFQGTIISEHLEMQDMQSQVEKIIDELPEKCRLVFVLSRFEEMSHKEIAHQLGISTKTVENHISKALTILRNKLLT